MGDTAFLYRHLKGECRDAHGGCDEEPNDRAEENSHGESAVEVGERDEDDDYRRRDCQPDPLLL